MKLLQLPLALSSIAFNGARMPVSTANRINGVTGAREMPLDGCRSFVSGILRSVFLTLCSALTSSVVAQAQTPSAGAAQSYPQKPLRFIVPLAAGGGNDTLARYLGKYLTESLGQSVVIENRTGGGGLSGGEYAARAAPDGYTLIVAGSGLIVVTLTHKQLNFQRDFTPIAMIGEYAALLVTHPSLPVATVRDVIKLARSRPGQLNFASAGNGSAGHLVMEMFRSAANIDVVHIPYKGAAPAATEVMAGQVSLLFNNPLGSMPHVKAGRLRALAVSGPRRIAAMPEVPTIAESGLPGFDVTFFLGLLGPLGLPREIVARLNAETVKIVQRRDFQEMLTLQGMEAISSTPESFAARIKAEMEKTAKVVRESGMRLN
jgi:tripartite-type tricarboxylate transporter receptor subunit TctC